MQNRYVGDIGDYGKYALLRAIAPTGFPLGVNWYLTPDESHNADGKYITYLYDDRFRFLDRGLYLAIKDIVDKGERHVRSIQHAGILPESTLFYDQILDYACDPGERRMRREAWHRAALDTLQSCDIVFLDPDNGLQVGSSLTARKGNKYIGLDELKDYIRLGKSVIFYNHRERKKEGEYLKRFIPLRDESAFMGCRWLGLKYVRGTIRDYFFILQMKHFAPIQARCEDLLQVWKEHFSALLI